ncbi:auxin-responsive protein SAUR72 [Neltuma alba]|uniref:auxin-responsive protein SAUR72 n=1 Tax=Neltuma alba TaxID=207710 RepID=UPI0010A4C8AB|nr:auxin-responsive protein SAUR72-like [Prosopis alba]
MLKQSKIAKVLKGLSMGAKGVRVNRSGQESGGRGAARRVPEGHFVVVAVKGEETKRFIVKLDCLRDPAFLRLLEKASEEFGFGQKGPLSVPCNPQELQNIIDNHVRST